MPILLKLFVGIALLWNTVYSFSYAIYEFRKKRAKSGVFTLILQSLTILSFLKFTKL